MKAIKGFVIIAICVLLTFRVGYVETYYTREGKVTKCNNDVIIIVDNIGEKWICDNCYNDVTEGCDVVMKMHNNHTNTIYDDIITDIEVMK